MRSNISINRVHGSRALGCALLLFFVCSPAFANISVKLAPVVIERIEKGGKEIKDTISFTNASTVPLFVTLEVTDLDLNDKGMVTDQAPGTTPSSLAPFLKLFPLNMKVNPGQRAYFRYSVKLPQEFSQLRGRIFFVCRPDVPQPQNGALIVPRLGVPLYIENIGARPAILTVQQVQFTRPPDKPDNITMNLDVQNEGQRNIRPKGYVEVTSKSSDFRATFPFNQGKEPVFPSQRRLWQMNFGPVPDEELVIKVRFDTSFGSAFEQEVVLRPGDGTAVAASSQAKQPGE